MAEEKKNETGYQSQYQDQLKGIMQRISQRQPFNYDLNGDALYKQYADQYQKQGRMAMMDTMGQAQAMTGGYGNSYAQNVGQQAYNGYLQQMNNFIPELYQMALNKYQLEGDDLLNQYSMLSAQDNADYAKHRDTVADQQWQAEFDEDVRRFNFANKLGEFAPVAEGSSGGGYYSNGGGTSGSGSGSGGGVTEISNAGRLAQEILNPLQEAGITTTGSTATGNALKTKQATNLNLQREIASAEATGFISPYEADRLIRIYTK